MYLFIDVERINWLWKAINGTLMKLFWRSGLHPTTAIGKLVLFKSRFAPRTALYGFRCGNVAAILELDEHLQRDFTIFEAAPQEARGIPSKKPQPDYFL